MAKHEKKYRQDACEQKDCSFDEMDEDELYHALSRQDDQSIAFICVLMSFFGMIAVFLLL